MKNILMLTKSNIKRNKIILLFAIACGIAISFVLYAMGHFVSDATLSKIPIGVMDYDQSGLSNDFKEYLNEDMNYELIETLDFNQLSTELIEKDISVIIEIPENFYEQYANGVKENVTITSLDDYENAAFTKVYINNYMNSIYMLSLSADGDTQTFDRLLEDYDNNDIKITQAAAEEIDKAALLGESGFINSVGFFLMLIFSICIVVSYMVVDDRLSGVFNRIEATPVKPIQYIIGTGVFGMIICLVPVAIYISYIYISKIKIGVPIEILALMMVIISLFSVCFSLALPLVVKSKNAITSIVIGFSTIGCILGGAYFPIENSPKTLQNLARILPQFWFMDAMRKLQTDVTVNIYPNILILSLFVVLCFLVGAVLYAQNYKNS
ncbi:MAG: ABC transporter permease [Mobilitalea sp.]